MRPPIDVVLALLDKVKPTGAGKWKACCPAHPDKDPSLGIKEAEDRKVLLHCWAGCTIDQIVSGMGLEMGHLFPGEIKQRRGPSKAAVMHEQLVYHIGINTMQRGNRLDAKDRERFEIAKRRLGVSP